MTGCIRNFMRCVRDYFKNINARGKFFCELLILIVALILVIIFSSSIFEENPLYIGILSILTSFLSAYFFVSYTYHRSKELDLCEALNDLVKEMNFNVKKVFPPELFEKNLFDNNNGEVKCFHDDLVLFKERYEKKHKPWIGVDKYPSFTNWEKDNFYLKYLPTTCFYRFINMGYISSRLIPEDMRSDLAYFYDHCRLFSNEIQAIENTFGNIYKMHGGDVPENTYKTFIKNFETSWFNYSIKRWNDHGILSDYCGVIRHLNKHLPHQKLCKNIKLLNLDTLALIEKTRKEWEEKNLSQNVSTSNEFSLKANELECSMELKAKSLEIGGLRDQDGFLKFNGTVSFSKDE